MLEGGTEEGGGCGGLGRKERVVRTRLGGCIRCRWCEKIFAGREGPFGRDYLRRASDFLSS